MISHNKKAQLIIQNYSSTHKQHTDSDCKQVYLSFVAEWSGLDWYAAAGASWSLHMHAHCTHKCMPVLRRARSAHAHKHQRSVWLLTVRTCDQSQQISSLKPGFHYPSWRPINSASGNACPSTLTGNGNRSPVNSGSGNRALFPIVPITPSYGEQPSANVFTALN